MCLCKCRGRNHRPAPIALDDGRSTEQVAAAFGGRTNASSFVWITTLIIRACNVLVKACTLIALVEFLTLGCLVAGIAVANLFTCTH
jgi:hypothetical protein